ncbi:MAG: phosphoribosyl-AMP cyclohydrolase [Hyphomonas sp.]|jgi:hypothetical protein|nr:phosphoribosyl-AMP cyclohydrolase [Hyphomonas sp.]
MSQRTLRLLPALFLTSAIATGACATAQTTSAAASSAPGATAQTREITRDEVLAAQQAWGKALVQISTDYDKGGFDAAKATAEKVLDSAYGYNLGPVLFKPTLTTAPQTFRTTRDGALAYFVGGDADFPADKGFALNDWRKFETENAAIFIDGDVAMSMGKVRLTNEDGNVTEVDKTWGYKRDEQGNLRIVLHHSSLPYAAN